MARTEWTLVIDSPVDDEALGMMMDDTLQVLAIAVGTSLTKGETFSLHLNGIPIYEGEGV